VRKQTAEVSVIVTFEGYENTEEQDLHKLEKSVELLTFNHVINFDKKTP
jgi:hypothetical protein